MIDAQYEHILLARAAIKRDGTTREQAEDALAAICAAKQPQIGGLEPVAWWRLVLAVIEVDHARAQQRDAAAQPD